MFWNKLFGIKKPQPPSQLSTSQPTQTIQSLKQTMVTLDKRENYLEKQIKEFKQEAKKSVTEHNKKKAMFYLKKAKTREKLLDILYGTKNNLESQITALETSVSNLDIMKSMKDGKKVMDVISKTLKTDDIDDFMGELSDTIANTDEISDIMSRPIGVTYDDEELLKELSAELEGEREIITVKSLPVPKNVDKNIVKNVDNDSQELIKLKKDFDAIAV